MASKRKLSASENSKERLPNSKRICDGNTREELSQALILNAPSPASKQTASPQNNQNKDKKFPFHKLIPELRNKIYDLILNSYFAEAKENGHSLNKQLSYNAIPYTPSDMFDPEPNNSLQGMKSNVLPGFEHFLKANEKLYHEFASMRIARSELWLNATNSPRDGVTPTCSHKGRRLAAIDKQYIEHITYSIM